MSGTIADKLNLLADTKENIRQAIINKGVSVSTSVKFADYPDKIAQISSGSAADEITAENATGNNIALNDKVWIQNASTVAGMYGFIDAANGDKTPAMDALGFYVGHENKMYFMQGVNDYDEAATIDGNYLSRADILLYAADGSAIVIAVDNTRRVCKFGGKSGSVTGMAWGWPIISNDGNSYHSAGEYLYQENPDDFSDTIRSIQLEDFVDGGYSYSASGGYIIGDYFYKLWDENSSADSGQYYRWNITTGAKEAFTSVNYQSSRFCIGLTFDNKYAFYVSKDTTSFVVLNDTVDGLRMIENGVSSRTYLSKAEMPVVLQDWYDIPCFKVFNPLNQVLTVAEYGTNTPRYGFYQYQNGVWVNLQITLTDILPQGKYFATGICIDRYLKHIRFQYADGTFPASGVVRQERIAEIATTTGYRAIKYQFSDENTMTGRAASAGAAGEIFDAEVILI
jgi:hypothetical protein